MDHRASLAGRREVACTVCHGTSGDTVFRENGYEGRACACGTIYTTPEPLPGEVDPTLVGHDDNFYDMPALLKARWVRKHVHGDDLLEIGCGTGAFLDAARTAGFRVEGIEAEEMRATVAARRVNAIVRPVFFENADADRRFDVVYHCDMLAHFDEPAKALRLMTRFLRPGGVLAFEVGFVGGLPRVWYSWIGDIGYPQHRWLYSERSLRRLLDNAGLHIEHLKRFDLAADVVVQHGIRTAARMARRFGLRRPTALGHAVVRGGPDDGRAMPRVHNVLRYRVGAWLPPLGPATALVIARPAEGSSR
jgi:SAM-dependent methyltransferase